MDANRKIIVATGNEGKMKEIRQILGNENITFSSLKDEKLQDVEIIENGKTFEENAIIKARTISDLTGKMVLADDSGLEVDYLDKAPGVYSARYLGVDTPYHIKNQHIIELVDGVKDEKRTARFVCAIACAFPDGRTSQHAAQSRDVSVTKKKAPMDLDMILSFMCRSLVVPRQNFHRKKRTKSVTVEKHWWQCTKN